MKILYVNTDTDGTIKADAGTDSAILRTGEPVFVPDPADRWLSAVAPAIRIHRLGTAIKASRAAAYYDAIAPVHILTPSDPALADGLSPYIIDRALAPGLWVHVSEPRHRYTLRADTRPIGAATPTKAAGIEFCLADLNVDRSIEILSRHMSFRTGDILVFRSHRLDLGVTVLDTTVTADIDGERLLNIRLK